jgi:acetoin utilization protein AcuB
LVVSLEEYAFSEIEGYVRRQVNKFRPEDKASRVLGDLQAHGHYEALVFSEDKVGLVTVRDLLDVVQPDQTAIGDHPKDLWNIYPAVSPTDTVLYVVDILIRNNVRALPVIDDGDPIGVICQVELMDGFEGVQEMANIPSKELMEMPVVTLSEKDNIANARRVMLDEGFSYIPIVQDGRVIGIITAKDIVDNFITPIGTASDGERIGEKIDRFSGTIEDIMNKQPLSAGPETKASKIIDKLTKAGAGYCMVTMDDGRVVGIITPREILKPLLQFKGEEELPVYIVGLSEAADFYEREVVEEKIRRVVQRALKIHPHLSEVSINIQLTNRRGNRAMHEVTANVHSKATEEKFHIKREGWDLMAVFDEISDILDRFIRDAKHEPEKITRREKLIRFSMRQK